METMERSVTVTYYGMLAEKIGKSQETMQLPEGKLELRSFFERNYPALESQTFSIAVDLQYTSELSENETPTKIDLMPPFAGG